MTGLEKLLYKYSVTYPNEDRVKEVIKYLKEDNCFSSSNFKGHFTASAWIVNKQRDRILMTHHRKLNMLLQLGGHADGESNLLKVAMR